jgi:hypothetical protein
MPSRLATTAIILFWLATTGWLVYRELTPRFRPGEAPPFTIDLTDEVSAQIVSWLVLQKDEPEPVGRGTTQVKRHDDRTFEFKADFQLDRFKMRGHTVPKIKLAGSYRVTEEGKLRHAAALLTTELWPLGAVELDFQGEVRERLMHPQLNVRLGGVPANLFPMEPFAVSDSGNIFNPMHLVHKISGLREGQSWTIPLMDPLKALPGPAQNLPGVEDLTISRLSALVTVEPLDWHGAEQDCFKIEYRHPESGAVLGGTWVRRRDALVLQQWASYAGIEYTLRRGRE